MKTNQRKRFLGLALSLAMLLGLLPLDGTRVFAQSAVSATVGDATIYGDMDDGVLPITATITLTGATFKDLEAPTPGPATDVTSWFKVGQGTIADYGMAATVQSLTPSANSSQLVVVFSGSGPDSKPTKRYSGGMTITIPSNKIEGQSDDLEVTENPEFKLSIGPEYIHVQPTEAILVSYDTEIADGKTFQINLDRDKSLVFVGNSDTNEDLSKTWFENVPDGVEIKLAEEIAPDSKIAKFVVTGKAYSVGVHYWQPRIPVSQLDQKPSFLDSQTHLKPIDEIKTLCIDVYPKLEMQTEGIHGDVNDVLEEDSITLRVQGDEFERIVQPTVNWLQGLDGTGLTQEILSSEDTELTLQVAGRPTVEKDLPIQVIIPKTVFKRYGKEQGASKDNLELQDASKKIKFTTYVPSLKNVTVQAIPVAEEKKSTPGTKVADLSVQADGAVGGITYTVVGSTPEDNMFEAVGSELRLKSGVLENNHTYNITLQATEKLKVKNTITKAVSFTVNLQQYVPTLSNIHLTTELVSYADRAKEGVTVATLAVEGHHDQAITYSLVDTPNHADNNEFTIQGSELKLAANKELQRNRNYVVKIAAEEQGKAANKYEKELSFQVLLGAEPVKSASVSAVTVDGKVGKDIAEKELSITLEHETFTGLVQGESVKSWIKNLTAGLDAKVKALVGTNGVSIAITGTPSVESNAVMEIEIPMDKLTSGKVLPVTRNEHTKFNITRENKQNNQDNNSNSIVTTDSSSSAPAPKQKEKVQESVNADVKLTGEKIEASLSEKAVKELAKNKKEVEKKGVEIKVNASAKAKELSLKLSQKAVESLAGANAKELRIASPIAELAFDKKALSEIHAKAQADLEVAIEKLAENKLNEAAKELVAGRPALDITIRASKDETISSFGGGKVAVGIPYEKARDEKASELTVYHITEDGKLNEVAGARYDEEKKAMLFEAEHFSVYAVGKKTEKNEKKAFMDIDGHWAKADIDYVAEKGLMHGILEGKFAPDMPVTRGMFVTVLGRMAGVKDAQANDKFEDVSQDMYYAPYIAWAEEKGIVQGMGEKTFMPEAELTREQMATIMMAYVKETDLKLADLEEEKVFEDEMLFSDWAKQAIKMMQKAGILSGRDEKHFDAKGQATRAELAKILHKLAELN